VILLVATAALVPANPCRADLLEIYTGASLDGKAWDSSGDGNYDSLNYTSGTFWLYPSHIGLLEFDLSALPAGATVNSAELRIMARRGGSYGQSLAAYQYISAEADGALTLDDATASSVSLGSHGIGSAWFLCDYGLDASTIESRRISGTPYMGFHLGSGNGQVITREWHGGTDGYVTYLAPTILIDYTGAIPEPTSLVMLAGLAASGLIVCRLRRKRRPR
jgi:hypothetical protein